MTFTCRTTYNNKALTAMARAMRKTLRRRSSRWTRVWGGILFVLCLLGALWMEGDLWQRGLNAAAAALLLAVQIWEDRISAFFSRRRAMPGLEESRAVFTDSYYEVEITGALTRWQYSKILQLAETGSYFVFLLGKHHAQAFDKSGLTGGDAESFRAFLEERTGKNVQYVGK